MSKKTMDPIIANLQASLASIILRLKEELKIIRTGRANPAIVEDLVVETYGGQTKLKLMELATITTDGPSIISIIPFDPSTIKDIEKAVLKSPLGFSPAVQGSRITVRIPPLSQEQREKYIKLINQMVEEKKTMIRNQRDEIRKRIKSQFEQKTVTEDNKFRLEKEIDNTTQRYSTKIQSIKENKEKEILEI